MVTQHSQHVRSSGSRQIIGLALAGALLVGVAAPARAGGDFEDAFEATLGSLLAFEAVNAGRALLFYGAPAPVPVAAPAYYPPPAPAYVPVPVAVPYAYPVPVYGVVHHHKHKVVHHHYAPPRHHGHGGHDYGRSDGRGRGNRYARY
jgi:hypothetical protein